MRKRQRDFEVERNTLRKQLAEHKERLAKAEAEREKHWSRVDGLESFVKDNRLFDDDGLINE